MDVQVQKETITLKTRAKVTTDKIRYIIDVEVDILPGQSEGSWEGYCALGNAWSTTEIFPDVQAIVEFIVDKWLNTDVMVTEITVIRAETL